MTAHGPHDEADAFDEKAATWDDDPAKVERARVVAAAITDALELDGTARLLEVGAGTGLVTQAMRDAVGPVTMADTSAGMREVMQAKVDSGAIPDGRVWDLDLSRADSLPDDRFDLAVMVLALHHIADVDRALHSLATLVVPGGHVCIVDFDQEDGSFHGEGFDGHDGFAHSELAELLTAAGFFDVSFQPCHQVERHDRLYPLFLATATRQGDTA